MIQLFARNLFKLALGCTILALALTVNAAASCGDSLASMVGGKAVVSSSIANQLAAANANGPTYSSIAGLWYVQFVVGGQTIQEAYQNWNVGGTEVHNPNVDPRTSNICLGTWVASGGSFKLAHRVWSYDTTGDFLGTIQLSETIHLSQKATVQNGSFKLDFYDPNGNFQMEVAGNVVGQRIQVE